MRTFYEIISENPDLVDTKGLSSGDIAAVNYIFMMSHQIVQTEVRMEDDGAWVHTHSTYNEAVDKIIENHPKAVELIRNLHEGYGTFKGGTDSQFAYLLVKDYANHNFGSDTRRQRF